jgi:hypothetical protein
MSPEPMENWEALQRGLYEEARENVDQALRVALMLQAELPQAVIAERLGLNIVEVKDSLKRLRRIAARIDFEKELSMSDRPLTGVRSWGSPRSFSV